MRFSVIPLALALGVFWGAAILIVAVANLIWPNYGRAFLDLAASLYPGTTPALAQLPLSPSRFTG